MGQPAKSSPRTYVFRNAWDSCLKRAVPPVRLGGKTVFARSRDEEGQHDRSECVGEGERRGLSIGKVPGNALLQALVKRSRTHHRGIAAAELHF
jgi:hypothetical protein